jgi:uncharacterized membrane protein HdeD (DUF308 family)
MVSGTGLLMKGVFSISCFNFFMRGFWFSVIWTAYLLLYMFIVYFCFCDRKCCFVFCG